ncbi:MAG TPA: holo-ACP synthase [Kofleriaceae bacterium]|nr:holo-ACP synthase [Kofleriaceae bacterium]
MIVGLGMDLTEVPRIARMVERWGLHFTERIFTEGERAYAAGRANQAMHLAARFAAKEATLKALAVPRGLQWHEMEVIGGGTEPPLLVLRGMALEAADRLGVVRMHLTLTHTKDVAAAVVIAEAE